MFDTKEYQKYLCLKEISLNDALSKINSLGKDTVLFVVDENKRLLGSLTDGDIRRALLKAVPISASIDHFWNNKPISLKEDSLDFQQLLILRDKGYILIPLLNNDGSVIDVINLRNLRSFLPLDVVIMAGGRGSRLKPLTDTTPKPMLPLGDKPIIEHNLDRLISFGIKNFWISIGYLGDQIKDYFKDGKDKEVNISYITEKEPLGTIGAVSQISHFKNSHVLITNSDIITELDYESFFLTFINSEADMAVVTIPYDVNIPYAVVETKNDLIKSFEEKPTYTYYSNGGIYLCKAEVLEMIPQGEFFNATDLMNLLLATDGKIISYPLRQYWLDVGKFKDYQQAQTDITNLDL